MRASDCDVLVIGSGAAGLMAALKASASGLRVRVIEKEPVVGGTTALSEGMIWAPLSAEARSKGIADTREAAIAYIAAAAGRHAEPQRIAAYVDGAAGMLAFINASSGARFSLSSYSIDYHQDLPGATKGARAFIPGLIDGRRLGGDFKRLRNPLASTMLLGGMTVASGDLADFLAMRKSLKSALHVASVVARHGFDRLAGHHRGTRIANGNGLVAALMLALKQRGVEIETSTKAVKLIAAAGHVTAVIVETPSGGETISARRGVVLCCGGFPGDGELQRKYYAHVANGSPHYSLAPASNIGDGLRLAVEIGAALNEDLAEPAAWTPVSLVPQAKGPPVPFPHYIDRGKPGVIAVTRHGRRFTNEADVYHRFVPAMFRACAGEVDVGIWLLADHRAIRRYGLGAAPPAPARLSTFLANGYLKSGRTIEDLALAIAVDPQVLARTVAAFNQDAARGVDHEFGKGSTVYNRANGDPEYQPNPCLAPLVAAPFYAVRVVPGDIATFVGLKTDRFARVLTGDGKPITGLYAAGNDAASAMGGDYPAAGITIGSAMTFGYLAARHIAEGR